MSFPTLYGTAVTGKTKVWSITVLHEAAQSRIQTHYGYEGGAMQTQERVVTQGKNLGKKNETSAHEQALLEARTMWTKKTEENYAPRDASCATVSTASVTTHEDDAKSPLGSATPSRSKGISTDVPLPMLAHDYHKLAKKIVYPCYGQPKFDGTRCVGIAGKGLFSRARKAYPHLEHIQAELDRVAPGLILDGELYSSSMTFQEIVGLVKKQTMSAEEEKKQLQISFHVYDVVDLEKTYEERRALLDRLFARGETMYLVPVETCVVASEADMKLRHTAYVAAGYEGIMLRNKTGMYVSRRSNDLQKYKEFCTEEYRVIGAEEGDGAEKGCVIWVCETAEGKAFRCRPQGTREDRQDQFVHQAEYIGKRFTVKFQELTDDGLPRFPVGIAFRDYE